MKVVRCYLIALVLIASNVVFAQSWEPVGSDSFEALAGTGDGSLVLIRYPGDILRSTDSGVTWHEVYHGSTRLVGFGRFAGTEQRAATSAELLAFGDRSVALLSNDSGRSWSSRTLDIERQTKKEERFEPILPYALYPLPTGTHSVAFADSTCYAVGEPGLICIWDAPVGGWRPLHRAPFLDSRNPVAKGTAKIDFSSAMHGVITVKNRMYVTNDSATTWSESTLPDTASISSFFLLSDTSSVVGLSDGRLYCNTGRSFVRFDSILGVSKTSSLQNAEWEGPSPQRKHSVLQIGWKDRLNHELFVLTDSLLYSVSADLHGGAIFSLPLRLGERALAISFPNAYTGFLLTDSVRWLDTLTSYGQDTTLLFDTSFIYRSLDGGATWSLVLGNIPGLRTLYFLNTKCGYVCGASGAILMTDDTGSHWYHVPTLTKQRLHDLRFVDDVTGYAVGDSGVVLLTQTSGRFWRPLPPEPLFMHPSTCYTSIAFPDAHTVSVVSDDHCYKSSIKTPNLWHPHVDLNAPQKNTFLISERPNPSTGIVHFDIRTALRHDITPTLHICNLSGQSLYEVSGIVGISQGEWITDVDLSFLSPGPYTAIATLGGEQAMSKFMIEK